MTCLLSVLVSLCRKNAERLCEMKAYLINSKLKTITPVDYNGDYESIYTHIGCDLFDVVYAEVGEHKIGVYVDDEGLLNNPQHFFMLEGWSQPLAGNGLVLGGLDEEGETLAAPDDLDLSSIVTFLSLSQVREIGEEAHRVRQEAIEDARLKAMLANLVQKLDFSERERARLEAALAAYKDK